jgi:hypothetical protein
METGINWYELGGAIVAGASIVAGALKLLARELRQAIEGHGAQVDANTQALNKNTEALTPADAAGPRAVSRVVPLLLLLLVALGLGGCPSTDPLIVRALERNQEVWEEDRRADLDPELVKSRTAEFEAQQRYAKAPK